ncbi:MAG: hypothetical protein QM647_08170 [Asticcacaulis sp.]|uniref:hypothetical protein n=1 Tax=Asticcacaulis sp. TaxID=1872648 RepID=UPI0039E23BFE
MRIASMCFIFSAGAGFAASVQAEEAKPYFTVSGQVTVATDGMSKNTSETDNKPQATAYIQAAHGPIFVGVKVKNVKGSDGSDSQQEYALGVKGFKGGFQLGLQAAYKIKVGAKNSDSHYVEWKGDVARTFGRTTAKLEAEYAADSSGSTEEALFVEASVIQKLSTRWAVSGGVATRQVDPKKNYNSAHFGVIYNLLPKTSLDLRFYDTDKHEYGNRYQEHVVLKLIQKL